MTAPTAVPASARRTAGKPSAWWTIAVALTALFLAARNARAQHGGFHTNMTQQGGRGPGPAPMGGQTNSQNGGQQGPAGGNSMFPVTPSAAGSVKNHLQAGPAGRWWDDKRVAQSVGLRTEQKAQMDAIFSSNKPAIVSAYQTFLKEKEKFVALSKQSQPDKTQLFASIDAVNEARTSLEKATDKMLLEIRAELDAGQLARLQMLQ